jgi:hypothetical protein
MNDAAAITVCEVGTKLYPFKNELWPKNVPDDLKVFVDVLWMFIGNSYIKIDNFVSSGHCQTAREN